MKIVASEVIIATRTLSELDALLKQSHNDSHQECAHMKVCRLSPKLEENVSGTPQQGDSSLLTTM